MKNLPMEILEKKETDQENKKKWVRKKKLKN